MIREYRYEVLMPHVGLDWESDFLLTLLSMRWAARSGGSK